MANLDAKACTRQAFGCGSCVTDGLWGVLWIEEDCSRHCDKSCGNESASSAAAFTLAPQVAGPNTIEMKVALPTEISTPKPPAPTKKDVRSPLAATSVSIVEKTTAFTYFANRESINCGALGPTNASITCNPPDIAHCACEPKGAWSKATCTCEVSNHHPASNNCKIDAQPHLACQSASLTEVNDPGCATNCAPGSNGICMQPTCGSGAWAQSICVCMR